MTKKKDRTIEAGARIEARTRGSARATVINEAAVLEVMQGLNPWWRGALPDVPSFRRTGYYAARLLLDDPHIRRAILLSGLRQVGKSTILRQLAVDLVAEGAAPASICYLDLSTPAFQTQAPTDLLRRYHENIRGIGKPAVLLLDEVQYADQWDLYLKQFVDHNPEYRIVATGSASLEHRRKLSESGVGRWFTVHVPTLSFWEYLHVRDVAPDTVAPGATIEGLFQEQSEPLPIFAGRFAALKPQFGRYLLLGGFPEAVRKNDVTAGHFMVREDVVDRVLKRDAVVLSGVRNVRDLGNLFVYFCMHTGGAFSPTDCASALGCTKATVYNYLQALQEANLVYLVPPFRPTGKKSLKLPPKVYLADAALRNASLLKGEQVLANPDEMGTMAETAVLRHLLTRYHRHTPEVAYWRGPKKGREVDFVVHTPAYTIPVEVKYRSSAPLSPREGLLEFCREHDVEHAYWVTQRDTDFGIQEVEGNKAKILRIPAHIFCYLLGQAERLLWTDGA
jgi:predicted AAA+ superfamily ATPase